MAAESAPTNWLLLIHQVPNSPPYLRVKIWRQLQRIGAVAVKNAVYVLPASDQSLEDFHWIAREIVESGGDASVCEATFVEGITNRELIALFQAPREADYSQLLTDIKALNEDVRKASKVRDDWASGMAGQVSRLRQKLNEIEAIDFFSAPGQPQANSRLTDLEGTLRTAPLRKRSPNKEGYTGRVWTTRKGIHVDRIASAWLIRRFIDPQARFKFVAAKGYKPDAGEIRFDMFDAEFTHEGDLCTFEVLLERMNISDRALQFIAGIVHDIDFKETRFDRAETAGIAAIVAAICTAHKEDDARMDRGCAVLDDLYQFYKRR